MFWRIFLESGLMIVLIVLLSWGIYRALSGDSYE